MKLSVLVVDSMSCNAVACSDPEGDFILIHRGLLELLPNLFRALLSHPDIFPQKGHPELCAPYRSSVSAAKLGDDPSGWFAPPLADPERQDLAARLSWYALQYVFEHELAHIYNGHTDWLSEHHRFAIISEVSIPSVSDFKGVQRQTLEFDADSAAVQAVVGSILQPLTAIKDGIAYWQVPADNDFGSVDDGLVGAIIACQVIHMLYEGFVPTAEEVSEAHHPHPAARQQQLIASVNNVIAYRTGVPLTEKLNAMLIGIVGFYRAWTGVFDDNFAWADILSDPRVSDIHVQLTERYTEQWAIMNAELDRLKRGGRLAPAMPQANPAFPDNRVH